MRARLLLLRVQGVLVDEDDAGEPLNFVPLDPVEVTRAQLDDHLRSITELCTARTAELNAQQKTNRASRRGRKEKR